MRTLIVDPHPVGHRSFYLALITKALAGNQLAFLTPSTTPGLREHFSRRQLDTSDYEWIEPDSTKPDSVISQAVALARDGAFDRVFFAYLDSYLEPLLSKYLHKFQCHVSGIWFHPYALDSRYHWLPPIDKRLKQRRSIHCRLRCRETAAVLKHCYFLDAEATASLSRLNPAIQATTLADPWERQPTLNREEARKQFGLPSGRPIFLHIGSSERRKGLSETLDAFEILLKHEGTKANPPLLLRVGENERLSPKDRQRLNALGNGDFARSIDGVVAEGDFIEYFAAADWVLLPYRKFRYSSGILSNAIATGKPVIASDYGLIGTTVQKRQLGHCYTPSSRKGLVNAFLRALNESKFSQRPDLVEDLSPENFISTIRATW